MKIDQENAVFELSIVTNDIYKSLNCYDIKRGGGCEMKKNNSCPFSYAVLYSVHTYYFLISITL